MPDNQLKIITTPNVVDWFWCNDEVYNNNISSSL